MTFTQRLFDHEQDELGSESHPRAWLNHVRRDTADHLLERGRLPRVREVEKPMGPTQVTEVLLQRVRILEEDRKPRRRIRLNWKVLSNASDITERCPAAQT